KYAKRGGSISKFNYATKPPKRFLHQSKMSERLRKIVDVGSWSDRYGFSSSELRNKTHWS
ncbi:hypothetical protein AB6D87_24850, partial [Vibrio lentus]